MSLPYQIINSDSSISPALSTNNHYNNTYRKKKSSCYLVAGKILYVVFWLLGCPLRRMVSSALPCDNQYSTWSASVLPLSHMAGSEGLFGSETSYIWKRYLWTVFPGISCFVTKSRAGICIRWNSPLKRNVLVSLSCFRLMNCPGSRSFISCCLRCISTLSIAIVSNVCSSIPSFLICCIVLVCTDSRFNWFDCVWLLNLITQYMQEVSFKHFLLAG